MCAMSIGELSRITSTPTATIRYDEGIGLLPPAGRGRGGQREYARADEERLRFIRSRRDLGFSIPDVRRLMLTAGPGAANCDAARNAAEMQLAAVRARQVELRETEKRLIAQINNCGSACKSDTDRSCALVPLGNKSVSDRRPVVKEDR